MKQDYHILISKCTTFKSLVHNAAKQIFTDRNSSLNKLYAMFIVTAMLLSSNVIAQSTTINTHTMGTNYTGNTSTGSGGTLFITFAVENNSGGPIRLTDVGNWTATSHNGQTSTLYYSATSLSGTVGTFPSITGWTAIDVNTVSGITATTVNPVNVNMNFIIPDATIYRFAILTTGTNYYSGTSATPNNFTVGGVSLYTGNYQISGQNVGYAATISPRYFTGSITFEPALSGTNNAGINELTSPEAPSCAGTYPIKVNVKNGGFNAINNVKIDWTLDNVAQTPINYNTTIASGSSVEVQLSAGVAFGLAPRKIKAWTTMPNGVADIINGDDTLDVDVRASLSGVYTVGSTGDFPTVVAAADALNQFGVCGPVVIEIQNGTYTGQVQLNNILGASATNRITFKSQSGNPANVVINATSSGAGYIFQFNDASFITLKDLTIASLTNNAGRVIEMLAGASEDSVINCTLNTIGGTSSNTSGIYAIDITGGKNAFIGNTINNGYYGIRLEGVGTTSLSAGNVIDNNTINDAYYSSAYFYYTDDLKYRNNTTRSTLNTGTHYDHFLYYCDGALEFTGNDIVVSDNGTSGAKYGLYMYYCDANASEYGLFLNNSVALRTPNAESYGMYTNYSSYQNFVNNSVNIVSNNGLSHAARFYYSSTTYQNNNIVNNVFSSNGNGYAMYVYNPSLSNYFDYNNIHSNSGKLVETNTPAGSHNTLVDWQTVSGVDSHSINYNPGFTSDINLRPNKSLEDSWSLNGRALQIAGNILDRDNNPRVDNVVNGVPDIGAYEFTPDALPPLCVATPTVADRGDAQVYTFGEQEVCTVVWGQRAPVTPLAVRQYSGRRANDIVTASPSGSMYFYTDIAAQNQSSTYDYDLKLNYMDIWLGNISIENDLRLAHRVPTYPWMVYSGLLSSVNTGGDEIDAKEMKRFGSFTGLLDGSVKSAFVTAGTGNVICFGNSVLLTAEPFTGDYYKWYFNGVAIAGAEGPNLINYNATQAGDYSVAITYNTTTPVTIESVPLRISTIAAPNAIITANGNLTYCTGNGLTLDAGSVPGVTYQWQLNGSDIQGATSSTYAVSQAGDYRVVATNIGCSSTSTVSAVSAGPLTVNLGNDTTLCEQPNVFVGLNAGYPGATYRWNTGDTSMTVEAKQTGTYWVEVNAGPNCIDRDSVTVTIDPLPSASGISYVQNGNEYTFFPSGPTGNPTGYLWIFGDGSQSTQQTPIRQIKGDLYVRLVLFNACGADTVQLGWPAGVGGTEENKEVVIYPNPAKDQLVLKADGMELEVVEVLNSVGALVYRAEAGKQSSHNVDVSTLSNGHYLLRATTSETSIINKQFDVLK